MIVKEKQLDKQYPVMFKTNKKSFNYKKKYYYAKNYYFSNKKKSKKLVK